ncbi:MAG: hypothetical protein QOJ92_1251 [Frankiales bacterium]|nr:hypothetical protein [Frankiales bacterium]
MTSPLPDPTRCPACEQAIGGGDSCAACGLPLRGPLAAELWDVDVRIANLRQRRELLIQRLRSGEAPPPTAPLSAQPGRPETVASRGDAMASPYPPAPAAGTPMWTPPPRKEWTPQRVQNTLLSLGVLLLAVAALVATAVAYRNVGASGRAAVLLLVTALAVAASEVTRRRSLTASAEATAALSVVLALVSARALRRAGLGDGVSSESFWTAATALVAVAAAAMASWGTLACGVGAALAGQVPLIITATRQEDAGVSGVLTVQVLLLVAATLPLRGRHRVLLEPLLLASAALTTLASAAFAVHAAYPDHGNVRGGVAALCALAAVMVTAAILLREQGPLRHAASGLATGLGVLALAAPARLAFTDVELASVIAVSALIVAVSLWVVPESWRLGPAIASGATATVALLAVLPEVVQAAAGPFTWLADPWSRDPGASARASVMVDERWTGQAGVAVVMVLTAATAVVYAALARRFSWARYPVAALAVLAALVTPLAVDTTYPVAIAWDLAVSLAAMFVGPAVRRRSRASGYACSSLGAAMLALTCAWSVADERASTLVLGVAAVACAVAAWLDGLLDAVLAAPLAAMGTALLGAETFAVARSAGAPVDRSGFCLAVAGCALATVVGRWRPRTADGIAAELAAGSLVVISLAATASDAGWTSWTLALAGLTSLATALRPERRSLSYVGALLLSASSWVRLADADVHAPEPYVLPLAAIALGLGMLRRRADRGVSSWTAYGPPLTLALVPSLVASLDDSSARRPLLLAVAATAVVIVGAVRRLQAPLIVGSVVLVVDAVRQLGAYIALVPRWLVIAALGLLLLVLGTTFEKRRRDVQRIQESFNRMS